MDTLQNFNLPTWILYKYVGKGAPRQEFCYEN
jgi:hypothetical protein